MIVGRPKLMDLGKQSGPKDSPKPASSSSLSSSELLAQWKEKKYNTNFVKKRTVKQRTGLIRAMCSFVLRKCKDCKNHEYKCLDVKCDANEKRVTSLFTSEEIDSFMKKRRDVAMVFGNPLLLLNPLHIQCPICGTVLSLGNLNDVIQENVKVMIHFDSCHKISNKKVGTKVYKPNEG